MRFPSILSIATLITACALASCTSSGLKSGQGGIDQNVRGGFFASYEGGPTGPTKTKVKGEYDGKSVDLEVDSAAPFVLIFGETDANTDVGTAGQSTDTNTSTTTGPKTDAEASGLPK